MLQLPLGYRMLNNQVLVDPIKKEEKKTAAGLILPEINSKASRNRLEKGKVILVQGTVELKAGEVVYYKPGTGEDIIIDGKPYLIIPVGHLKLVQEEIV